MTIPSYKDAPGWYLMRGAIILLFSLVIGGWLIARYGYGYGMQSVPSSSCNRDGCFTTGK